MNSQSLSYMKGKMIDSVTSARATSTYQTLSWPAAQMGHLSTRGNKTGRSFNAHHIFHLVCFAGIQVIALESKQVANACTGLHLLYQWPTHLKCLQLSVCLIFKPHSYCLLLKDGTVRLIECTFLSVHGPFSTNFTTLNIILVYFSFRIMRLRFI